LFDAARFRLEFGDALHFMSNICQALRYGWDFSIQLRFGYIQASDDGTEPICDEAHYIEQSFVRGV
jgi:hypothetical protein